MTSRVLCFEYRYNKYELKNQSKSRNTLDPRRYRLRDRIDVLGVRSGRDKYRY